MSGAVATSKVAANDAAILRTVVCPHCNGANIAIAHRCISYTRVTKWTVDANGEPMPENVASKAIVDQSSREVRHPLPYLCMDCGTHLEKVVVR